jgi:cytochrome b561
VLASEGPKQESEVHAANTSNGTPESSLFYDTCTIRLHWLTAGLVVTLWGIAQIIDDFPTGMPRISARSTHILLGIALVVVVAIRVRWRMTGSRRLMPVGPAALASLATTTHRLLYAGLIAVLLLGMANAWTRGDTLFRLVTIPKLLPEHSHLKPTIENLHKYFANGLVILAALHALAALFHHYRLKNSVLRRMLGH